MGMRDHIPGVPKRKIGDAGRASEKKLARHLGAQLRPASGAMAGAKGDMTRGDYLIEAKSTTSESMGLKLDWLAKVAGEARSEGKTPALSVRFTRPDGTPLPDGDWVCMPRVDFDLLVKG